MVGQGSSRRSEDLPGRNWRLVQAHVVDSPPTPTFCTNPHFLTLWPPETRRWHKHTWLGRTKTHEDLSERSKHPFFDLVWPGIDPDRSQGRPLAPT